MCLSFHMYSIHNPSNLKKVLDPYGYFFINEKFETHTPDPLITR